MLDEHEKWLLKQTGLNGKRLTTGHLSWRRHKIPDLQPPIGMSKPNFFRQEYPSTAQEAFISTGRAVFNTQQVMDLMSAADDPIARYDCLLSNGQWFASDDGQLRVWEEPIGGQAYIVAADIAEGLEHGDFTSMDVIKHVTGEQVAHWHGHIHPEQAGDVMAHLGKRYNLAWLVPERNNHGLTTVTRLRNMDYRRLYVERVTDIAGAKSRKRYGWVTNKKTKPLIIDTLAGEMLEDSHGIRCKETFQEMLTFETKEDTTFGAQEGEWDDRVMSIAIVKQARRILPLPKIEQISASQLKPGRGVVPQTDGWLAHV